MLQRLSVGLLGLAMASCGTLDGVYQRIEVDSAPRGATVYLGQKGDREAIGTSPIYYDMRRSSHDVLTFKLGDHESEVPFDCKFRWVVEGVGHGALALLSWQAAIGATVVDLVTGGAYECPTTFFYAPPDPSKVPQLEVPYCRRYLVVAPAGLDPKFADILAENWMKGAVVHLRGCDDFLPYEGKKFLSFLNVQRSDKPITAFDDEKLAFLAYETQATHLAVLSAEQVGSAVEVRAEAFDLHRKSKETMTGFERTVPATKLEASQNLLGPIPVTIDAYPNAMVNGYVLSNFGARARAGYEVEGASRTLVDSTLRRVSFLSVIHPFGFNPWDYVYGVSSSVMFFTDDFRWKKIGDDDRGYTETSVTQIAPIYYFDVTALTPFGSFSYDLGAGGYLGIVKAKHHGASADLGLMTSTKASYTYFLTKSLFGQASLGFYHVPWRSMVPEQYRLRDQTFQLTVAVGYYFPDWH